MVIDPSLQVQLSVKLLVQLGLSPLDGLQSTIDLPGSLVEVGQLLVELLHVQV